MPSPASTRRASSRAVAGRIPTLLTVALLTAASAAGAETGEPFFPGATYRQSIPTPESILGFPVGERAATPLEIEVCLRTWAEASPRARLTEYGRTHEDRPLFLYTVSSPENLARLDEIQQGWARVADPRGLAPERAEERATSLPAVAWLAYSIHGDETSGADAALALAYHLTAAEGEETERLLEELVVILDPMMNPDGRDRFLKQLREHSGRRGDRDDQSLYHTGYWPYGRGNHYLFDLNRDWVFATQPETRGRLAALARWHPLLFVDAHEMGAQETYLFYPPREPINPYLPEHVRRWWQPFGQDQARAFDAHGWPYYTGEWSEDWYPGYSNSWAAYRGAVGLLYEQAGIGQGEVARPEGVALTYREAVHHQVVSSLANLGTLHRNREEMARDFAAGRRRAVSPEGPFAGRTWAFPPAANRGRLEAFAQLLGRHGLELYESAATLVVEAATDPLGREATGLTLPRGTLLVPNRQPEGALAAALLTFDLRFDDEALARERRELLRHGRSLSYDVTAWSLPLLYGLEAYRLPMELPAEVRPWEPAPAPGLPPTGALEAGAAVAVVVDGADDRSLPAAARMMERGLSVRVADRPFRLDEEDFTRGSLVVTWSDNRDFEGQPLAAAVEVAGAAGLAAVPVSTGLGAGELPDLGGGHFPLLEPPRIALLARGRGFSFTDAGTLWHWLDQVLGLRLALLDGEALSFADLRRYNVVILPDRWGEELPPGLATALKPWVEAGGTVVAVGQAAAALARAEDFTRIQPLEEALGDLGAHRLRLLREWMAEGEAVVDPEAVWAHQPAAEWADPWDQLELPGEEERESWERRDRWQRLFMPQGAIFTARVDPEHWLTAGAASPLPVLVGNGPVLLAGDGTEAPVRLGWAAPGPDQGFTSLGWGVVPAGRPFYLRLAGLLWPEAAQRLANGAYLARQRLGAGQLLLFAFPPTFRSGTPATARLFANAVIFGPGLGAHPALVP